MPSQSSHLVEPKPAPALNVPNGDVVTVRIIDRYDKSFVASHNDVLQNNIKM